MEEDIKILEDFINNEFQKDKLEMNEKGGFKIGTIYKVTELSVAIENLIKGYRELEERNSNLNESNNLKINKINELEKENQSYRDYLGEPPCYDNANYIQKSRIKAKIEELNNYDSEFCQRVINHNEHTLTEFVQNILQELMEDK